VTEKKKIRYEAEREIVVLRVPEPIFEKDELQEAEERRARRAFRNTNGCLLIYLQRPAFGAGIHEGFEGDPLPSPRSQTDRPGSKTPTDK
jgi:hypothetical protein